MKRNIFLTLATVALLLTSACTRIGTTYDIPAGSACVSFPAEDAIFEMLASDGNKITVELWRGNTQGAASVAVDIEDGTGGVFTPSKHSFDFAAGEAKATIDFTYPDINAFGGEVYEIKLTVSDPNQLSPAAISEMTIQASRKLTPVFVGTGVYYSDFYEEAWEQDIYTTEEAPNYYILPSCWANGTDFSFTMVNGKPVWPASFNTGAQPYGSSYGYLWIKPGNSYIEDGVLYLIVDSYFLPSYGGYDLGSTYEAFELPAGVNL